jgi:hypothetical protein
MWALHPTVIYLHDCSDAEALRAKQKVLEELLSLRALF